jgi:hypothetical protein
LARRPFTALAWLRDPDTPAGRPVEVLVGLIVLASAVFFGYFGVKGAMEYAGGSRAAPADPLAWSIGIGVGLAGGYLGLRLITGWREEKALLPNVALLLCGLGAIVGGIWVEVIGLELGQPFKETLGPAVIFTFAGMTALRVWWRRRNGVPGRPDASLQATKSSANLTVLKDFTDRYLAALPPADVQPDRPLAFAMSVPSERVGQDVVAALSQTGFTRLELDRVRVLIRKRWQVSGLSLPVRCLAPDVNRWLDEMDALARAHGAVLETWFPTALPGEEVGS